VNGVFTERVRREHVRIINELAARGCDAVALVCTEIPVLLPPDASPLPTLDSTRLLARAALGVAIEQSPMPTWRGGQPETTNPGDPHDPLTRQPAPDSALSERPPSDRRVRPHPHCDITDCMTDTTRCHNRR